jgi:putative FmdB family regulatory protein
MAQYMFECPSCEVRFSRSLKMTNPESCACPSCGGESPRYWEGQGFGFGFEQGKTPGNTGVSKHDNPTADQAVGSNADQKWAEFHDRDKVKQKVREVGQTHAITRRHVIEQGKPLVEYGVGGEPVLEHRRQFVKEGNKLGQ